MAKRVVSTKLWPRAEISKAAWVECAEALGRGEGELFALFAEVDRVHMAFGDREVFRALSRPGALEILEAFNRIADPRARQALLYLAREMSQEGGGGV